MSSELKVGYRTVDGLQIRYADSNGSASQHLVLTSPWPESLYAFDRMWSRLSGIARLLAIDLPGFGRSERRIDLLSPTAMSEFLIRILDEWNISDPHLVCPDVGTPAALFAATHPSRTTALVVLEGYAHPLTERRGPPTPEEATSEAVAMWGTGELQHLLNPDMPWNEEIRATWAHLERLSASPRTAAYMMPLVTEMDVRAILSTVHVPTLVLQHTDDIMIPAEWGKHVADEFVLYRSGRAPIPKAERIAAIERQKKDSAVVTLGEVETMRLSVYGDSAAMIATHVVPDNLRPPYRAARVWVKRNGQWQMAISVQTEIKAPRP